MGVKNNTMTKDEAIQAMNAGEKVTHEWFSGSEYITMKYGRIHDEDDFNIDRNFWAARAGMVWDTGWSIYNAKGV